MKTLKSFAVSMLAIAITSGALADAARTFYSTAKWNVTGNFSLNAETTDAWTNSLGEAVVLAKYNDNTTHCVIEGLPNNVGVGNNLCIYGLTVNQKYGVSSGKCWFDGNGKFQFVAGGVSVLAGNVWFSRSDSQYEPKIYMAADQTWRGGDTVLTHFGVGRGTASTKATLFPVTKYMSKWTIEKNLAVWLYSPSNNFAGVDVTVKYPARLVLPNVNDARLRARTLTLTGDGEALPLAKAFGYTDHYGYNPTTIAFLDTDHIADTLVLKDGADLTPGAATVFDMPTVTVTGSSGDTSEIAGPLVFSRALTTFAIDEGVTLSLPGANTVADGVTASVAQTGAGTLEISSGLNGTITMGASSKLVLLGEGKYASAISGGSALEVRASGLAMLGGCDLTGYTGSYIDVTAGTLELGSMNDLPAAAKLRTSGEGKVMFGSDDGLDVSRIEGTKNYVVDATIITDTIRKESSITVGVGETLHVRGNGLTAATQLIVAGGTVAFEANGVMIASPVSVTAASWIRTTANAVTGTISGAVTAQDVQSTGKTNGVWVVGPGCVTFAGGGTFTGAKAGLSLEENASVKLTQGDYTFTECPITLAAHGTTISTPRGSAGKYLGVLDGGNLSVLKGTNSEMCGLQIDSLDDGSAYFKTATFEVGTGCTADFGPSVHAWLGSHQALGKIRVSGGTLKVGGHIYIGYTSLGTGVIEVDGGTLVLSEALQRLDNDTVNSQPQGRIDLTNATIKLTSSFGAGEKYLIRNLYSDKDNLKKRLRVWTRIMGDCTLDLTDLSAARTTPLANAPAGFDRAEWFGTGTLTVKGGKTFVMNSVANGVGIRVADDGTKVILPEDAQVFDYATCEATKNAVPYKDVYSTTNTCLANLSLPTFAVAGMDVALSNGCPTRTISIGTVLAEANGCFDAADTLLGVGTYAVTNLTFAENAVLGSRIGSPTLAIAGAVTFPAAMRLYAHKGNSRGAQCVVRAAEGVAGSPTWTLQSGSMRRVVRLEPSAGEVWLDATGLMLLVR